MIAYILLWMVPPTLILSGLAVWLSLRVLKEQQRIQTALASIDQSHAIESMKADLSTVMRLVAQDVRMAGWYKADMEKALAENAELVQRAEAAEAAAELEKNRRIGAVKKLERTRQ